MVNKLSEPIILAGKVIHGEKVGRTIGFPTANLDVSLDEKKMATGVYFGTCVIDGKTYSCLPYFGPRLIFGEVHNVFEVYIYALNTEIYDQMLRVQLTHFLRAPRNVTSLEELQTLLENDKATGQKLLTGN